jgi:hypothetical protein
MGLLASIVAYLSVVAAIVIGFMLSADALLNHSHHQATEPRPEITTAAKADTLKTKKAAKSPHNTAELRAIPRKSMATEYRRKTLSDTRFREQHKRSAHEAQRRYWPLHRAPAAAPRAFGYAEESRFGGDAWR